MDGVHPVASDPLRVEGEWRARIHLAGSETSPIEAGYLADRSQAYRHEGEERIGMRSTYRAVQITRRAGAGGTPDPDF